MDTLNLRKLADEQRDLRDQKELAEEDDTQPWDSSDQERLDELNALAKRLDVDEIDECHETLVNDNDMEEYARQYAEDSGLVPSQCSWPLDAIDWKQASQDLLPEMESIEFEGDTYWMRSI